jgi:hypothetical protein
MDDFGNPELPLDRDRLDRIDVKQKISARGLVLSGVDFFLLGREGGGAKSYDSFAAAC